MLFLLGLGLLVLVAVIVLKWAPGWLATGGLNGRDEAEEVGRTRTAILAALAGVIAVVGAVFTGLSYRLNRAGQVTERFTRAVDQLGGERLEVRLGGIYALERIARDSKHDHPQVVELLSAFVREHAALSAALGPAHPPARTDRPRSALPADVQAALTVLGRRNINYD